MKTRWIVAGTLAVTAIAGYALRAPLLETVMQRQIDRTLQRVDNSVLTDGKLHVILCGTAAALPDPNRAGPCTAVIANGEFWLIDAGPGSWRNLDLMNLPVGKLSGVLLTHFHSDHIGELGEAATQSWIAGRDRVLPVYGPSGVVDVVEGFTRAYRRDQDYRVAHHGDAYMPRAAHAMQAQEIPLPEGDARVPVLERNGLRISAFRVQHEPVDLAYGYRFEYGGRVVVVSGDTRKTSSVIANAKDADLLVHEALATAMTGRASARALELGLPRVAKLATDVGDYHATPVQAAETAQAANAKKLVITHVFPPLPNALAQRLFLQGASQVYAGPLVLGEDGQRFELDPLP